MTLMDTDWNTEWMQLQAGREFPRDASYWDKRADDFSATGDASAYALTFIEYAGLSPGESVLDVGSGSGTLALPLARAGHAVCAVDFSERMLAILRAQAAEEGLGGLRAIRASWEDDWPAAGIRAADVAVASRSIAVTDLRAALRKLDASARRRVCLTAAVDGVLPALVAHATVGRDYRRHHDYVYVVNVLFQMGILPDVRFMRHEWNQPFADVESARAVIRRLIAPLDEREEAQLGRYLEEHLQEAGDGPWKLDQTIVTTWAFIAWDKSA